MKNIALITGSYGGLGTCFANLHAKNKGDLILVGRNAKNLEQQKNQLENEFGIIVKIIVSDLQNPNSAQNIYDECHKNNWNIDFLINNAGFGGQGEFVARSLELDSSMIEVNVSTLTKLTKLFLQDFVKKDSGKVLNVSSTAAFVPGPLQAVYYATKAYVTSFSNSLWRELKKTNVSVTTLMPGAMKTGFEKTASLSNTKLFSKTVSPVEVARDGYKGMLKGKLNVVSGLTFTQKIFVPLMKLMPKKLILNSIYNLQVKRA